MLNIHESFDLSNGYDVLRIISGAFFVPHIVAKFREPAALDFFVDAKLKPPKVWMYVACAIEIVLAVGLLFGIFTTYVGWSAAVYLAVAAAAVYRVSKGKWLWTIGGMEYCVFWALCCAVVAMHG